MLVYCFCFFFLCFCSQNWLANIPIADPVLCHTQQKAVLVVINYSTENMLKIHSKLFTPGTLFGVQGYLLERQSVPYTFVHSKGPLITSEGLRPHKFSHKFAFPYKQIQRQKARSHTTHTHTHTNSLNSGNFHFITLWHCCRVHSGQEHICCQLELTFLFWRILCHTMHELVKDNGILIA